MPRMPREERSLRLFKKNLKQWIIESRTKVVQEEDHEEQDGQEAQEVQHDVRNVGDYYDVPSRGQVAGDRETEDMEGGGGGGRCEEERMG